MKRKPTLSDFDAEVLNRAQLKCISGGYVPPPADPGDTNDPTQPPPKGNHPGYIDPDPDNPLNP
ncbi:hypothetical protein NAT51_11230 [Flavobacterium amniphilum]|uniref:hypothetical protein n=1 Tax=Flavobacterium amniphilum TaxID=1834035 RepID=UPI002029B4BA|nr:hypothetical protein [Flavobacterium amniphilum]MCL9806100.1 hypothetical protein [Flavobacterium amniphilum]